MIPRDPRCDNDECYEDEDPGTGETVWVHVGGCDAEELPLITDAEALEMIRKAPPTSFLATTFGPALTSALTAEDGTGTRATEDLT